MELEASSNPFAVVTQVHLKVQETAGSDSERYRAKLGLIRGLYRRGYQRTEILELFRFIDWVLALPEELEDQLWVEVRQFEEEKQMHYASNIERIAQHNGQDKLLDLLIRQHFGALPEVDARLREATPEQLETWALRILTAGSLEEVFAPDGEQEIKNGSPH